jgi:hypothetical protein
VCSGADAARSVGEAAIRGLLEIRGERLAAGSGDVVSRYFGFHIGGRIAVCSLGCKRAECTRAHE